MRMSRPGCYVTTVLSLLFFNWLPPHAHAQLNQNCVVSVLNRNVQVNADGTWVLPNIPANFGPVRPRTPCPTTGEPRCGTSFFSPPPANVSTIARGTTVGQPTHIP